MFKEIKRYEEMYRVGAFEGDLARQLAKEAMAMKKIHFIKRWKLFQSAELASNLWQKSRFIKELLSAIRSNEVKVTKETFYEKDDWRENV